MRGESVEGTFRAMNDGSQKEVALCHMSNPGQALKIDPCRRLLKNI